MFLCLGHSQLSVICTCGSTLAVGRMDGLKGGQAGGQDANPETPFQFFLSTLGHTCINTFDPVKHTIKFRCAKLVLVTCLIQTTAGPQDERRRIAYFVHTHVHSVSVNDLCVCVCVCVPPPSYCVPILSKRQKAHLDLVGWKVGLLHRALLVN